MPINKSHDENIPSQTEAYYEKLASQEEKYLEETEEELRAIVTFDDQSPLRNGSTVLTENCGDRELFQTEIRTIQTSDGPENAMFYTNYVYSSRIRRDG